MGTKYTLDLTQGNITNGHIYLHAALDMFPADVIGGSNIGEAAPRKLILYFDGLLDPTETDIAGDKKIFRNRARCAEFFRLHDLRAGDQVVIEQLATYAYSVRPVMNEQVPINVLSVVETIKAKFVLLGGTATIPNPSRGTFAATLVEGGISVGNLGNQPFLPWAAFQEGVCAIIRADGTAKKGDAMRSRLGEPGLSLDSIEGHIARVVYGKRRGDSVFRRITPIAGILIWAGICENQRGGLRLRT